MGSESGQTAAGGKWMYERSGFSTEASVPQGPVGWIWHSNGNPVASQVEEEHARRIVASVNFMAGVPLEDIEQMLAKGMTSRERELEAALRDVIEHTKTCGYDCEQGKLADSVNRARAALAAPAGQEGKSHV